MGGVSPIRLIRFPGEPAIPAGAPLAQSFMLGDALVANEVVETASSKGDAADWPFEGEYEGFRSGDDRSGGGEGLGDGPVGFCFGLCLWLPRAC